MVLTNAQIFTKMGVAPAAARNVIIADFLSEGLEGLVHMSDEDVRDTCTSYAKRQDGAFPIILTPILKQRMKSLVMWVKDQHRIGQPLEFPDATTEADLKNALVESLERERRRKTQKKEGENYLDSTFNNNLKSAAQWQKWVEELNATLCQIIGVRGIPVNYVIRPDAAPAFDATLPYEAAVLQAVTLTGVEFTQDARTVHKIILKNVHEDSDAYTYVKPLVRHRNGRRDMLALRERYSSDATQQNQINKAKSELAVLRYKNERSFSFEKFSAKLQKAYDDLEDAGRTVDNGDVVDDLWDRIQVPDLQVYIAALKVEYQRNPRDYKLILQDIAAQASSSKKPVAFARSVSATYTKKGPCPTSGVHATDGSIFIGSYSRNQWQSDTVKPFHQEIQDARNPDGGGNKGNGDGGDRNQSRSQKRRANAIKRNKKKLKTLTAQISAAKAKLKKTGNDDSNSREEDNNNHAGNAFGGKRKKSGQGKVRFQE